MTITQEYRHVLTIERALMAKIQDSNPTIEQLCKASDALNKLLERKRIIRMKPKPRDVDVSKLQKRQRSTPKAGQEPFTVPEPLPVVPPVTTDAPQASTGTNTPS